MKKTLKILMAIILFAVVLTIATSVNAAVETITVDELIAKVNDDQKLKQEDGILKVLDDVDTEGKTLVVSGDVMIDLTGDITGGVQINGTSVIMGSGDIDGTVTVNGTVYASVVPASATFVVKNNGIIYEKAKGAVTAADIVEFTLAEAKKAAPVVTGTLTTYTDIIVTEDAANAKTKITLGNAYVPGETEDATKIEASEKYNVDVTVKFGEEKLDKSVWTVAPFSSASIVPNCTATVVDGVAQITVDATAEEGDVARATVKVTNTDVKAEIELTVGEVKVEEPEQPEEPTNPEDPTNPDQPANPDAPKGDLDDAASVATGDHIIPATALLAVVVVANVVYFAKMKNN